MTVEERLKELGIVLPAGGRPAGNYLPYVAAGELLFISGQVPYENGVLRYPGKVGSDLTEAEGMAAARLAGLNVLAQIRTALNGFDRLKQLVRVEGFVQSAPGFNNQHKVLNGASDLFAEVLQEKAGHARAAFGNAEMPLNVSVELVVVAAIRG
jgi:enamine deaminase RidA (YjgF/YER057c/UK114 family)